MKSNNKQSGTLAGHHNQPAGPITNERIQMRYEKPYKCTSWAIVATIERKDGTWYTDTITEIDDDTASSVDTFLNEYIDEKNEDEKN